MYGFYQESANKRTRWDFKTVLFVSLWVLFMFWTRDAHAATVSVRVIRETQDQRLSKIVSLISNKAESEGDYELDVSEVCGSPELVKKYNIAIECVNYEEDVNCENPKDPEEIEGCNAGEDT